MQPFDEGENPFLHETELSACGKIAEHRPSELILFDGLFADAVFPVEKAVIGKSQHQIVLDPPCVGFVEVVYEHQISDLFDDVQRIDHSARREYIP